MSNFTNFLPSPNQEDVVRTTVVSFTIVPDAYGVDAATISASINGTPAILAGQFINNYSGRIFAGVGKHVVGIYPRPPAFLPNSSEIAVSLSVRNNNGDLDAYEYFFYTYMPAPLEEPGADLPSRACVRGPFFVSGNLGLAVAMDDGLGTEVTLTWNEATPYDINNMLAYNIYVSEDHDSVFQNPPRFMSTARQAVIGGLTPGMPLYFGVRAAEFGSDASNMSGLSMAGPDMFWYPLHSLVGRLSDTDMLVEVDSVYDLPDNGVVQVGTELIHYSSLQVMPPALNVATLGRGFYNTLAQSHDTGTDVYLWHGIEDSNTLVAVSTPTFQKPNYALTQVLGDGYGPDGYRDGYDGYGGLDGYYMYRHEPVDSNTTDGTDNDSNSSYPRLDYCGTWRAQSPASFMQGQCTNTYFGGAQWRDGNLVKTTNVQTHMLQREELLLETTGEPFVLLRRMWTGTRCLCFMNRREHPDARCPVCFNTGFVQGYIQFLNTRRSDRRILARLDAAPDDLAIMDKSGLEPVFEPTAWTTAFPMVKDRDILVRFNADNTEEFRYVILDVTRVRSTFAQAGAQKFRMKRLTKSEIIYQFPVLRDTKPRADLLETSVSSSPGVIAHSHFVPIVFGTLDTSKIMVATLESEHHNHVIFGGKVYQVLGHTHTL